jgi:hypothetical protein
VSLWDPGWYDGHWTLNYSLLFAPIAATLGIAATDVLCAALASWAFDRLVVGPLGVAGRIGAIVFAAGTLVQVAIGRVPFLLGVALALLALLAALRSRRKGFGWLALSLVLALAASLASPLAGAFLGLAALAWLLGDLPQRNLRAGALFAAASLPVVALELLFPAPGRMPFATANLVGMLIALAAAGLLLTPALRTLRIAFALYAVALVGCYVVPSALGGNITRLGSTVGLGLVLGLPLARRGTSGAHRLRAPLLLAIAVVPLALAQWSPAANALLGSSDPASSAAYFRPLLAYLEPHDRPLGRIEVVPTADHWEADYVAIALPLARGWERQLDTVEDSIFYDHRALTAGSYRAWLERNGVRFVALADAPLDYAGVREGRLVSAGVPGLKLVWRNADWRVYQLLGAPGILDGAGRLVSERGSTVVLSATRPGKLLLRIHYASAWHVHSGRAALSRSAGGWIELDARRAGPIVLRLSL